MKKILLYLGITLFLICFQQSLKVSAENTNRVWFYNSADWPTVYAYFYKNNAPLFGPWPGNEAIQEGNSRWWYIEVPDDVPFNIIFNSGGGSQAGGVYIEELKEVYTTVEPDKLYNTKEEAEEAAAKLDLGAEGETTVWFYNTNGWKDVYLYVYGTITSDVMGPWPGTLVNRVNDTHWYKVTVPIKTPFNVIFNDGTDANKAESYIRDEINVYLTVVNDVNYADKESAEASIEIVLPIPSDDEDIDIPDTEVELTEETIIFSKKSTDFIIDGIAIISFGVLGISTVTLSTMILLLKKNKLK